MMVKFIHPIVVSEIAGDALVALFFEQAVEYYRALAVGVVGDVAVVEFGDQVNGAMPFGNFLVVAGRDVAEVVLNFTSPQTRNVASAQLRKGKRLKVAVFHFNWQQLHHGVVKAAGKKKSAETSGCSVAPPTREERNAKGFRPRPSAQRQ